MNSKRRLNIAINRISARDTFPIRKLMIGEGDLGFPKDRDEHSFHLGAFVDKKLVGIATFLFERHPKLPAEYQFQLRGNITLPEFRCLGVARTLLNTARPLIKRNFCDILWSIVPSEVSSFYEKMGFSVQAEANSADKVLVYINL